MWTEAHITILVSAGSAVTVALIALAGSKGTSLSTLLANEQRRRDECEKALREADDKHEAAIDLVRSDRDKERMRADLLTVQVEQLKIRALAVDQERLDRRQGKHP